MTGFSHLLKIAMENELSIFKKENQEIGNYIFMVLSCETQIHLNSNLIYLSWSHTSHMLHKYSVSPL